MSDEAALRADDELAIAIIGMACRFPGANDAETFWNNLRGGIEAITTFSVEELRARGVRADLLQNPDFVRSSPVIEGIEYFDAPFFGYSPRDAEMLDPQQRVFLECAWAALENAGYGGPRPGSVGVFAGTSVSTYLLFNLMSHPEIAAAEDTFEAMVANDRDFLATRVAYHLDLRGPSLDVQTGCSTSLVATHLACQALLGFQCDMALAGGVSIHMPQRAGYVYQPGGIASPDGHCRAFDADANGTLFGSGVGVVVLKRLDDAIRDGDTISAIIRGSAINNDGAAKVGFTAPSVEGQAEVIARAHAMAGVSAERIAYVETHGTATPLGDSVEVAALTKAFRAGSERKQYCALGSVKTNVGHLDAASGVAGLIKTSLALRHGEIPPTLHFSRPNPRLDLENSPFFVNAALEPWPAGLSPRLAGVSSIGIGGTNAHAILEEPPQVGPPGPSRPWHVLVLSAKTPEALDRATQALAHHLASHPDLSLADVAYTLQVGRKSFTHRRAIVCTQDRGALDTRSIFDPRRVLSGTIDGTPRLVAFMFPGSGTQHAGMGAELYRSEPVFRKTFDRCAAILGPRLGADLRDLMSPRAGKGEGTLTQPSLVLTALFAIEYSLAQLWISLGIEPAAMIGHGMGEYVAACLAGVFSLEDALALVAERGRLLGTVRPGATVSVDLPEKELSPLLGPHLSVVAVNGPESYVIAGEQGAIDAFVVSLDERDIEYMRLPLNVAAPSHLIEPILPAFAAFVHGLRRNRPKIPFVSCVTCTWIRDDEAESVDYWVRQLRQTVRFGDSIRTLLDDPRWVLLEVGLGRALSSAARQQMGSSGKVAVLSSMCLPQEERSEIEYAMTTLSRLWLAGVAVPWERLHETGARRRIPLPTYPFERRRFWVDPRPVDTRPVEARPTDTCAARPPEASGKKPDVADWFYLPSWKRTLWPEPAAGASDACWLVFAPLEGPLEGLSERLAATGATVITVRPGAAFRRIRDGIYEIEPRNRGDYTALLDDLAREKNRTPTHVLHAFSLLEPRRDDDWAAHAQDIGFQSLLFVAQSLGGLPTGNSIHLMVLSSGVQAVTGNERLRTEHATLLGICRVLPREHLNITCRSVDLDGYPAALAAGALTQLVAEAQGEVGSGNFAHRGAHRWEQTFEPVRLEPAPSAVPRLRSRGVYLVTGGFGGMGLALAEHLARTVKARLVLVGRSSLPARDAWAQWCETHGEDDNTRQIISRIQAIEALGGEVLALQGDVADAARMAEIITQARAGFGELSGVIHAAGVPPGGLIHTKGLDTVEGIFRPKVMGALVLHRLLRGGTLDFFVVCSTRTAIVGDFGQVDHCAANAFLDAFAQRCAAEGSTHITSINWDAWRDVGQAATAARAEDFAAYREMLQASGISTAEGIDIFDRVLARAIPQIIVSTRDLSAVMAEAGRLIQALTGGGDTVGTRLTAPIEEIERMIAETWQRVLGIERIDLHESFFDIGGNSLIGLKVIAELKRALGVVLPVVALFERPTIAGLARLLHQSEGEGATYEDRRSRGARRRERLQRRREDK